MSKQRTKRSRTSELDDDSSKNPNQKDDEKSEDAEEEEEESVDKKSDASGEKSSDKSKNLDENEEESEDSEDEYAELDLDAIERNPDKYLKLKESESQAQKNLIAKIKSIKWTGTFAASGTCFNFRALTNPGLYIEDKPWSFPLLAIPDCSVLEDAPFGEGKKTRVNPKVRKTLQVSASNIKFKNPAYETHLQQLAKLAARDLGLVDYENAKAHLHKLLIYREGDHFLEHRDAVHRKGMFGTLIVELPSVYTGGTLTVSHAGQSKEFMAHDEFQSTWVAFYGDCLHKIDPVTSGLRTVLTYDLVRPVKGKKLQVPDTVDNFSAKQEVLDWLADDESDKKLFIACEHLYPRDVLLADYKQADLEKDNNEHVITVLKGADQARARAVCTEGLFIGIAGVTLDIQYDPEDHSDIESKIMTDGIDMEDDWGWESCEVKPTQVFAPNGFKKTPMRYMRPREYISWVGNHSQFPALELTYSAIVLIKNPNAKKKKQTGKRRD